MSPVIIIGIAVVVAIGVIVWGIVSVRTEKDIIEDRLSRIENASSSFMELEETPDEPAEKKPSAIQERLDSLVSERTFGKKWRQQLSRADLKLTVSEYAAVHVISMFGFFALGYFVLFGNQIVMGIVSGFVGFSRPAFMYRASPPRV